MTSIDRSSRQKIGKATEVLNDTIDHLALIDSYGILYPIKTECTFFPSMHGIAKNGVVSTK